MLYELRVYTVTPGRLGDTLDRWRDLPAIFAKHGIDNVGRWYATAGPAGPNWVYLMAYRDFAERDAQWSAFYGDDAWWSLRTETNAGEEMTERFDIAFLRPNGVWQTPEAAGAPTPDSLYELTFAEIAVGQNAIANDYLGQTYVPLVARAGGRMMMLADFVAGPSLPKVAWIVAWPDAATRETGRRAIEFDAGNIAAIKAQRAARGRAAIGRTDSWVLSPAGAIQPNLGYPRPA